MKHFPLHSKYEAFAAVEAGQLLYEIEDTTYHAAVHAAEMMCKGPADPEAVKIISLRFFDNSLHIFNIHMRGMHQRPGDLIFFIFSALYKTNHLLIVY